MLSGVVKCYLIICVFIVNVEHLFAPRGLYYLWSSFTGSNETLDLILGSVNGEVVRGQIENYTVLG